MTELQRCILPQKIWEQVSSKLVHGVEEVFYKLGVLIASNPWKTLIYTLIFTSLTSIGLLKFHIEKDPMKLWVPPESDFFVDTYWFINTFESGLRLQKILVTGDNVLTPEVLKSLNDIIISVSDIQIEYGDYIYKLDDLCLKVPRVNTLSFPKIKRSATSETAIESTNYFDQSLLLTSDLYCSIVESFEFTCLKDNILTIWNNDNLIISHLSKTNITEKITKAFKTSSVGNSNNIIKALGSVTRDKTGNIVGAKSMLLTWYTKVNFSAIDSSDVGNLLGTEEWVSKPLYLWENEFLKLSQNYSNHLLDLNLFYESGRSFGDITEATMMQEIDKLLIGIMLMFIYIQVIISRCNWLEIKFTLGSVGLLCVGLSYLSACSWCSIFGIPFGPVHSSLPFLLMGLGIDDMFVMNACWDQLQENELHLSLPIKVGLMLKHAGVSIVITSFTDIVALLVGAITILPSLHSFCIYAAVGVFFIFCYSVTFYVAVFTLDLRRIQSNRNGIVYCYKHKNIISTSNKPTITQTFIKDLFKKIIFTTPVKTMVILFTVAMTAFSIESILHLEQRFDPKWFIPQGTYYKDFLDNYSQYYPNEGSTGMIFLGKMDYNKDFSSLYQMVKVLKNESYIQELDSWVESFYMYTLVNFKKDMLNVTISDKNFHSYLSRFLFSSAGGRFQLSFKFTQPISCGVPVGDIIASTMQFKFIAFTGPKQYIPAMNKVKRLVKSTNITTGDGYRSVWSKAFANWVTDEIIAVEVERNIELALLCVMFCTIILITNIQMCFWIFVCVLLTLVNVLGCMQRWNMTIDIVCCIGLELAIGLCVDYAAHVGHTFLTISTGTRSERSLRTVTSIGTAVLYGGGATLLSLSLLSTSKAYTFQSFFKIFLLVIVFGLYHGLIFLPVILSLIGPTANLIKSSNNKVTLEKDIEMESLELQNKSDPNDDR